jgi:acyl-CoA thioesterase FadM
MSSEILSRPRFEGSNICTWIGFKHVMYLIEEAVLEHLRRHGMSPRELYERQGLGVEIVDSDVRIATAVHLDDLVRTEVEPQPSENDGEVLVFKTASYVDAVRAATATVRVRLDPTTEVGTPRLALNETVLDGRGSVQDVAGTNAIVWQWRIPYFYCHYSQRLQHSGYLRLMEEVVDVFLARRGISIRDMLAGRRWIPVVPSARVRILEPAFMEETVYTVFTVENIYKNLLYTARMDCYVPRDDDLVQTATGRITHGYAEVVDRRDWRHVPFDEKTMAALRAETTHQIPEP